MKGHKTARAARQRRHERVRKSVEGTAERPRLAVFRSLTHIYAQVIDDAQGRTVAAASDVEQALRDVKGNKSERAKAVGSAVAKKAIDAGVTQVVFDRGGNRFHGRVKALAEAAREAGLKF
ncbi:MAG TPA: 50S ribosomal protein L18 [Dehalococcoidia bacterium]|jgi:large subunit ribosomal protein L18|nr:50S ribosomal protein L18 [Dehalococcoidia bacterium]